MQQKIEEANDFARPLGAWQARSSLPGAVRLDELACLRWRCDRFRFKHVAGRNTPPPYKSPLPCHFPVSQHVSRPKMSQITAAISGDSRLRCTLGMSPMLLRANFTTPPLAPLLHLPTTSHSPLPTRQFLSTQPTEPTAHSPRFRPGNLTLWHRAGLLRFSGNMSRRNHSPTLWTLR